MARKALEIHCKTTLSDKKLRDGGVPVPTMWEMEDEMYKQTVTESKDSRIYPLGGEAFYDTLNEHIQAALRALFEAPKPRVSTGIPEGFFDSR